MRNILDEVSDERQFSALTGITRDSFNKLLPIFSKSIIEQRDYDYVENIKDRKRVSSPGNPDTLKTDSNKLFFTLYYMKNYPTFDVLGFIFGLSRSSAQTNLHKFLPVLERAEKTLKVLPKDTLDSPDNLAQLADNKGIIIDATERSHYRHKDKEQQKKFQRKAA